MRFWNIQIGGYCVFPEHISWTGKGFPKVPSWSHEICPGKVYGKLNKELYRHVSGEVAQWDMAQTFFELMDTVFYVNG